MSDGKIEYDVRADTSKITSDLNAINQLVQRASQETQKKVDNIGKTAEKSIKPMTEAAEKAAESIDDLGESADSSAKNVKQLGEENEKTADKTEDLGKEAEEASKKIKEQGEQSKKSAEHTDRLKDSVDKVEKSVKSAKETIGKYALAAGAAFTAVGTAAVKAASDAETSFAKVKTLLSDGIMVDDYYNSIKTASANTGVSFGNIAESVYSAISASVDENKAVAFTENAVKLAKGGFTEAATAVDVLTTAINAYGKSADDAAHISDVLITTQNAGKTTVDELARSMGQTIPVANAAHTAIEELSTDYAVLTKNGVATAEAGTQIKAMYNELNASGTKVSQTLKEITGKSFADLKDEGKTTADVLNTLSGYAEKTGQKLSDLFGSVEAGSAALTLVKDGGADFAKILDQMQNSAGATEKAYETMSNTIEERINKLKNRFAIALTDVGEDLIPKIEKFADYIDNNFDEISETINGIGDAVEQAAEFIINLTKVLWDNKEAVGAAVTAYVAFKSAAAISNVITTVVNATKAFTTATQGATIAQEALNVAMSANPAGLVAAGIAALTVGLVAYFSSMDSGAKQLKEMSDNVRELGESARTTAEEQKKLADVEAEYKHINETITDVSEKKERLVQLQQTLNDLYGDEKTGVDLVNGSYEEQLGLLHQLNDQEKFHAKIQIEEELKQAQEQLKQAEGFQFPISFKFDENTRSFIYGQLNDIYEKWQNNDNLSFTLGQGASDERNLYIEGTVDEQIKLLTELRQALIDSGGASNTFAEQFQAIDERLTVLNDLKAGAESCEAALKALDEQTGEAATTTAGLSKSFLQLISTGDDTKKQLEEIDESTKSLISEYGGLYDALENVKKGGALSYDQMQKLIELYPELADKVETTADGYTIEAEALDLLGNALDDSVSATIEAEKAKTQAVIDGTRERIIAYNTEISMMHARGEHDKANKLQAELQQANKDMDKAEARLKTLDTLPDYIKGGKGKSGTSSGKGGSGSGSGTTAAETSGKDGKKENEDKYDKKLEDLEYQHNMGEIDDAEYYKRIGDLRDEYLEPDSKKWRAANVSIHRYEESLKKKAKNDEKSSKKSKGTGSSGTIISIDSYIPSVWDTDEEKDAKLKKAAELGLSGNKMYTSNIRSISTVGSSVASTAPVSATAAETTLTDVVSAIKDMQTADENKKISLEVELKARDLTIGKVCIADINDITRANGKSPLIMK